MTQLLGLGLVLRAAGGHTCIGADFAPLGFTREGAKALPSAHGTQARRWQILEPEFAEIDDPVKREEFLKAMAHGSAAAWEHINLLGEYDLSEEKFKDSVGIKPPKLTD